MDTETSLQKDAITRENGVRCLDPKCTTQKGCELCCWNEEEAERREGIPLTSYDVVIVDESGNVVNQTTFRRKYLGLKRLREKYALTEEPEE